MTITIDLPKPFYEDHQSRDLPSGKLVKVLHNAYRVELDRAAYEELLSDARHYASPEMSSELGWEYRHLVKSARATVRRLEKAGFPGGELVRVRAGARAWESSELWTSYPPIHSVKTKNGDYLLDFEREVAERLLDWTSIAQEGSWCVDVGERSSVRALQSRLREALS